VALGIILIFNLLPSCIEHISVSSQYSKKKLLGDLYNNRRSAANSFPQFAYSFVFLMLHQYYWSCDSYSADRRSPAKKKNFAKTSYLRSEFTLLLLWAQPIFPASLISAGCHALPIILAVAAV
jgi:hypothetical protein